MTMLLQISDPHFGTERPEAVEALVRLARQLRPSLLVLSGDLTQRARAAQFAAASAFTRRLGIGTVLALPGNHDVPLFNLWGRLVDPYRGWRRAFGSDLEPNYEDADWLVLCVKTTRRWRHKNGEVSARQAERVAQRLRQATPRQLRVVVTHQPVLVQHESDRRDLLRGGDAAVAAWSAAGVDLVLSGHIHLAHVRPLSECVPGAQGYSVLAGTAVSHRVRHGFANSVNVVHWRDAQCSIARWDHDPQRGFVCAETRTLELRR